MNKKAVIFTGMANLDSNIVGTAVIYLKIIDILKSQKYKVDVIVPEKTDLNIKDVDFHVYKDSNNKKVIDKSKLVIFGAYPPIDPMVYAHKKNKIIISYLWSIAPIGSLEFSDFKDMDKQAKLHQYITSSYNLSLLLSDKIFCRDKQARKFIMGSMISLGILNQDEYKKDRTFENIVEIAQFGIDQKTPKHREDIYRNKIDGISKKDFLLIWNGGIWNWNDGITLIKAMNLLRKEPIKLIFQGYKHPNKYQKLSKEANKTISLAKKLKLVNKNVFFVDQWVPFKERGNYLTECDAGIVTSPNIPEANLFLKTRIYDYIWADLPILANDSEAFSNDVEKYKLGLISATGSPSVLADNVRRIAENKKTIRQIKSSIKEYKDDMEWSKTLKPIYNFFKRPMKCETGLQIKKDSLESNLKIYNKLKKQI